MPSNVTKMICVSSTTQTPWEINRASELKL